MQLRFFVVMSPIPVPLPFTLYLYAGMLVVTGLVIWCFRISARQAGWQSGGWRTPLQALGWGGLLAIISLSWLRFLLHTGNYLPIPILPTPMDWAMLVFAIPVVEELFFRGAVFGGLQRTWSVFWAIFLSATLSVICLPMQHGLAFIFLGGIGYALAYRLSGSILAPILAHMLVAAALLLGRMNPGDVSAFTPRTLGIWAVIALLVILLGLIPGKQKAE